MNEQWVDASKVQHAKGVDIWDVDHSAHPLLDPEFLQKDSRQLRLIREAHGRVLEWTARRPRRVTGRVLHIGNERDRKH